MDACQKEYKQDTSSVFSLFSFLERENVASRISHNFACLCACVPLQLLQQLKDFHGTIYELIPIASHLTQEAILLCSYRPY